MQMLWKFHIVPGHLYGHQGCLCRMFHTSPWHVLDLTCWCQVAYFYFRYLDANLFVHMLWMLQVFRIFPGHLPGQQGCFSGFSSHPQNMYYICMCCWLILFWRFTWQFICAHALDAPGIPHFPRTTGVVLFRFSGHYIMQMLLAFLGHLPGHCGLFLSGFCTSCRCSGNSAFSWAIYPDTGVVIFRFSAHYIMQMFQFFLRHLHGHGAFFSGFSAHYIMQMFRFFSGHLHRHRGCFFQVFHTVETSDIIVPGSSSHSHQDIPGFGLSLVPFRIDGLGHQWNYWLYGHSNRLGIPGPDFGSIGTDMHWSHLLY